MMRNHGLFLVFLGIDDGTDEGLAGLNKNMTVKQSISGIRIIKKLKINFDYGFMLFQPSSDFDSVIRNIDFLENLCHDGSVPLKFLKIRPYFETKIEKDLLREGKLKGKPGFRDYDFDDPALNSYYEFLEVLFGKWMTSPGGVTNAAFWARNYIAVFSHFYCRAGRIESLASRITDAIARSNNFMADTMKELACIFMPGKINGHGRRDLDHYREKVKTNHQIFLQQIADPVNLICRMAETHMAYRSILY
jgi:hypothetical protein